MNKSSVTAQGNTCQGMAIWVVEFWPKINIVLKGKYCILSIDGATNCQKVAKSDFKKSEYF